MSKIHTRLAKHLTDARKVSKGNVIKSSELERVTREKLTAAGYLYEIMRGWHLLSTPDGQRKSTLWYSNYWDFVKRYLKDRFGEDYCLTPESSLDLLSGQNTISRQVTIMTKKPSNQLIQLPHDTSLMLYQDHKNFPTTVVKKKGLNYFPLVEALCRVQPKYFLNSTLNLEICLKLVANPSDISKVLIREQLVSAANRILGAFQSLNDEHSVNQIRQDLLTAGMTLNPINPFETNRLFLIGTPLLRSPYAGRISAMWDKMRKDVIDIFPKKNDLPGMKEIKIIERLFTQDSYHSLSIEGYRVTPELIEKISKNEWNPESNLTDREQIDALAAKGYQQAFQAVLKSISKVIKNESPGKVFYADVQDWYRELFKPLVQSGLMNNEKLLGYRDLQVYISGSKHVPPPASAILDSMNALEEKLKEEKSAAVRAILGHFIFVFIHPYIDGNGRIGRFTMNLMLISGGFNWTVLRVTERDRYMSALEAASVDGNIIPFAKFVLSEMNFWTKNRQKPSAR